MLAKLAKVKFYTLDQEIHKKVKKTKWKRGRNLVWILSHVTGEIVRIWRKRRSIIWPSAAVRVVTTSLAWAACQMCCVTSSRTTPRPISSSPHWCSPPITVKVSEHASKRMLLNFWRMAVGLQGETASLIRILMCERHKRDSVCLLSRNCLCTSVYVHS